MNCESSDACARRTADLSESDLCDRQAATREDAIDRRAWPSPLPAEPCSPACLAGCWICRGVRSWSNWPRGDEDGRSVGPSLTTTNAAARLHAIFCTADASQQSPFVRWCKVVPVFLSFSSSSSFSSSFSTSSSNQGSSCQCFAVLFRLPLYPQHVLSPATSFFLSLFFLNFFPPERLACVPSFPPLAFLLNYSCS